MLIYILNKILFLLSYRKPATTKIVSDDVSKFLPPGFKLEESTTSTSTDASLIEDILSSIEQDDLEKLLPDDFKSDFKPSRSRPKPPRLFKSDKPSSTSTTVSKQESTSSKPNDSVLGSIKFDDISAFLPPGKSVCSIVIFITFTKNLQKWQLFWINLQFFTTILHFGITILDLYTIC